MEKDGRAVDCGRMGLRGWQGDLTSGRQTCGLPNRQAGGITGVQIGERARALTGGIGMLAGGEAGRRTNE